LNLPTNNRQPTASNQPDGSQSGFTLVELLVAIVIVGLISALAVPALRKAQEFGERGRDISNLRQTVPPFSLFRP
jgi:prepilin-type N-terminal cleavage/methylation domain-containing protein